MPDLSRRAFLVIAAATPAAAMPAASAALPASAPELPPEIKTEDSVRVDQFMVGNGELCCDWRWHNFSRWTMGSKDGVQWFNDGPLNEEGRQLLLDHFHLHELANELPVSVIAYLAPYQLVAIRRRAEKELKLPRADILPSTRLGGEIAAELCA